MALRSAPPLGAAVFRLLAGGVEAKAGVPLEVGGFRPLPLYLFPGCPGRGADFVVQGESVSSLLFLLQWLCLCFDLFLFPGDHVRVLFEHSRCSC